jgi:hypothetical protein
LTLLLLLQRRCLPCYLKLWLMGVHLLLLLLLLLLGPRQRRHLLLLLLLLL